MRLTEKRFWRDQVSATFHGRDIFGPVAGHLSLGVPPEQLGPRVTSWVELALPAARLGEDLLEGEVIFIDDFGNLLTDIPGVAYRKVIDRIQRLTVAGQPVEHHIRTYNAASAGSLVALVSSADTLEVAVVQGSAATRLGASVGAPVRVELGRG